MANSRLLPKLIEKMIRTPSMIVEVAFLIYIFNYAYIFNLCTKDSTFYPLFSQTKTGLILVQPVSLLTP
jgi:hypothetical protein